MTVTEQNNTDLFRLLSSVFEALDKLGSTIIQPWFETHDRAVQFLQKERNIKEPQLSENISILEAPLRYSYDKLERIQLLNLAIKIKKEKLDQRNIEKLIEFHTKEFEWIPTDMGDGIPWNKEYFRKRLKKLIVDNSEVKLQEIENEQKELCQKREGLMGELNLPPYIKNLFDTISETAFFRLHRRYAFAQTSFYTLNLQSEVAHRMEIPLESFNYLVPSEIQGFLLDNIPIKSTIIDERKQCAMLYSTDGKLEVLEGNRAVNLLSQEIEENIDYDVAQTQGKCAYPGKIKGSVKVIMTRSDLNKIVNGDILIATQTTPQLIYPVLNRIGGIITEEGSLTCHAALISIENKIPCLVGVKHATKIFKDGENVILNSQKEIVIRK
jgi:phosphohistidine swiveling domain-containing protein